MNTSKIHLKQYEILLELPNAFRLNLHWVNSSCRTFRFPKTLPPNPILKNLPTKAYAADSINWRLTQPWKMRLKADYAMSLMLLKKPDLPHISLLCRIWSTGLKPKEL